MSIETVAARQTSPQARRAPGVKWVVAGATALMCAAVIARAPLWGQLAWGTHETPDFVGNLPLLGLMALVLGAHGWWMRAPDASKGAGRVLALGALMLALTMGARLGENAGWGRLALLTVNSASSGFFEAAYDSQNNPNWLRDYPDLMKRYHHVHSHPPAPVGAMRFWLGRKSPALTESADNLLAISPGVTSEALAQFAAGAWKKPYVAADVGAAFWGGMMWLACALVVPGAVYVATNALFGARAALHGGALACAVPSLLMFVPCADLSYVACASLALAGAAVGSVKFAEKPKIAALWLALSGVAGAVGVCGSFAGAWTILLTAIFLLWRAPKGKTRWVQTAIFGGAAVLTLILFQALGVNWLLFWRSVIIIDVEAGLSPVARFVYHFADFFAFLGVPTAVILWWGLGRAWKREALGAIKRDFLALAAPTLTALLVLNLTVSLSETARIWMLFMPPLLVAVGGILGREETTLPRWVLVAQLVQCWVFVVFLNVWSF